MPVFALKTTSEGTLWVSYDCPGCGLNHNIPTGRAKSPSWSFNGDVERPTLSPSILATQEYGPERTKRICHHFVREGMIEFLSDCTHKMAGVTLPLPPSED